MFKELLFSIQETIGEVSGRAFVDSAWFLIKLGQLKVVWDG
jgi:hypothetical protein